MTFARYAILVLLLVVLGLVTVWEHLRLLSIGYRVNELRAKRCRLEEAARVQERRIEAIATRGETAARVRALGLELVPGSGTSCAEGGPASETARRRAPDGAVSSRVQRPTGGGR